jgi:hypothetical protein
MKSKCSETHLIMNHDFCCAAFHMDISTLLTYHNPQLLCPGHIYSCFSSRVALVSVHCLFALSTSLYILLFILPVVLKWFGTSFVSRSHLRDIRDRSVLRLFESTDMNGGVLPGAGVGVMAPPMWDQDQTYWSEPEFDSEYQHQHIHKTKVGICYVVLTKLL